MNQINSEFTEDDAQKENEDDIGTLEVPSFTSAVVSGNDWTTETLVSQINKKNILLNPTFQRRDAWDRKRKSRFIESLVLGLPIPQVVLAESKEKRGSYLVLDGKQRLLTIRQFAASADDENYDQLVLQGLQIRSDLNGMTLESMKESVANIDDLMAFENQAIRTVVLKNWQSEEFLYLVFLRLNTGSVSLSPQELRQALIPGKFVSYLDQASSESEALKDIFKLKKPDFRMRDAELLLHYYAFKNYLPNYSGTLKNFLDDCCSDLNENWEEKNTMLAMQLASLEDAHIRLKDVFDNNQYKKWNGTAYESRFNRAIFDIFAITFSIPEVIQQSHGKEREIEDAFKMLCVDNREFLTSIESTTKSLVATYTRISAWTAELNDVLGVDLPVPELVGNRIV